MYLQLGRHAATAITTLFLALSCLPAAGQTVYRCGNHYSDQPCMGAATLTVDDSRSPAQKAQTDAATAQTRTLARQMEQERLALEKSMASNRPTAVSRQSDTHTRPPSTADGASAPAGKAAKARKKKTPEPPLFTAATTPTDKKNKSAGSSTD